MVVRAVCRTCTIGQDFPSLNFFHNLIKTEVAKDEAGLKMVQGGDIPGSAATVLLCLGPGTFQLTVRLGVVTNQL